MGKVSKILALLALMVGGIALYFYANPQQGLRLAGQINEFMGRHPAQAERVAGPETSPSGYPARVPTIEKEEPVVPEKPLEKLRKPVGRLNTSVWLHNENNWKEGLESLDRNREFIGEVNPVWYTFGSGGGLVNNPGRVQDALDLVEVASRTPTIKIRPVITNVTSQGTDATDLMHAIGSVTKRRTLINEIVRVASRKEFAGVDLDFEGAYGKNDFGLLADFLVKCTEAVHKVGKTVNVDLELTADADVLDVWKKVAQVADSVRVLVYAEHYSDKTGPGPVATVEWSRKFLEAALVSIPKNKLTYAIPTFGYMWRERRVMYSVPWSKVAYLFNLGPLPPGSRQGKVTRGAGGTPSITWGGGSYKTYFEDARSIQAKVKMAQSLGITHFAFWRIGGEDPAIWKSLN